VSTDVFNAEYSGDVHRLLKCNGGSIDGIWRACRGLLARTGRFQLRAHAASDVDKRLLNNVAGSWGAVIAANVGDAISPQAVRERGRWIAAFRTPPPGSSLRLVPATLLRQLAHARTAVR
jgi:hypothetical protein